MPPVSTTMGGMVQSLAPDVCNMPVPSPAGPVPTPTPYVNMSMLNQANPATCAKKVKFLNMPVVTINSMITMSSGDEPGCMPGGVASGMIKGPVRFSMSSVRLNVEGQPAIYQACAANVNGASPNTVGNQGVPSQVKVMVNG